MGALTFDALLRSLKQGAPDAVYYLHGEEDELKDEAVRALVERAVDPAARDFNLDQRAATDLDPEAFNALVNTPPCSPPPGWSSSGGWSSFARPPRCARSCSTISMLPIPQPCWCWCTVVPSRPTPSSYAGRRPFTSRRCLQTGSSAG